MNGSVLTQLCDHFVTSSISMETRKQVSEQACCPACGSRVLELRGQQRCRRCGLTLCIGCEAEVAFE